VPILRAQHFVNEAGLTTGLDVLGQAFRSLAPGLLSNHIVMLARPAPRPPV
jgi:hypothetical protein